MKKLSAFLLTLLAAAYIFLFILPALTPQSNVIKGEDGFKSVLTLWHIESFEGGAYARSSWLTQAAASYEQENKGVYVHINTLTYEQAQQKLQEGECFDLISFPSGEGLGFLPYLISFSGVDNTAGSFSLAGKYKGVQYALPYLAGIYCLIAQQSLIEGYKTPLEALFSSSFSYKAFKKPSYEYLFCAAGGAACAPLHALYLQSGTAVSAAKSECFLAESQYKAYEAYLKGNAVFLAGTQRDAYRLNNRYLNGQIGELAFSPLTSYNDLLQFIAGGSFEEKSGNRQYATKFIEYLTSDKAQSKVAYLEMFSPCLNNLYDGGWKKLCEAALYKTENFLHAFADGREREELERLAAQNIFKKG